MHFYARSTFDSLLPVGKGGFNSEFQGQDSVGSATAFTLYFLAKYQDVQERVYEELRTVFRTQNENITMEHLQNMKYLEQCVKETLRLAPSIPLIARVLTEDVKLGIWIEKCCIQSEFKFVFR